MSILGTTFRRLVPKEIEVTLGQEYDRELLRRLEQAVESLGGSMRPKSWGVGGSQELCVYEIRMPVGRLTATAETYVGLSLRGPEHLVQRITAAISPD